MVKSGLLQFYSIAISNSSVVKFCLKVLRSLADLQLHDSQFQTEEVLMLKAFADHDNVAW